MLWLIVAGMFFRLVGRELGQREFSALRDINLRALNKVRRSPL